MGNFYTNITLADAEPQKVVRAVKELQRQAYVATPAGQSAVVFDRECDEQKTEVLSALADRLSGDLGCLAFAVLNHDDDILWFQAFERTRLVAEYANRGGPRTDIRALCRAFGRPRAFLRVWLVLWRPCLFQVSRHMALAKALGLPECSISAGYRYISKGESPEFLGENELQHT
jgi:hypothetical protein